MKTRLSVLLLLPLLLAADAPEPSRVTLDDKPRPLGDVLTMISRQTNTPLDASRAVKERIVKVPCNNLPLWEALERVAEAANHRLIVGAQGSTIALAGGPDVAYRRTPHDVRGPFRFAVRRVLSRLDLDTGQSAYEIQIDAVWEPRLKVFHAEVPAKAVSARDERGRPLTVAADGSGKMPVTGSGLELSVRLPNLPRNTAKIAQLDGELRLVGTTQTVQFIFDPMQTEQRLERAEIGATLKKFAKAGRIWRAIVELEYPKGGPEFESFESYLRDNEVWLLRSDGEKFPPTGFELGAEHMGRTAITYLFKENDKDGPVLANLKDWKLVVRAPGRIVEIPVKFQLRDIPLP